MVILKFFKEIFFYLFSDNKTMSAESNQAELFARVDFPLYAINMVIIYSRFTKNTTF